MLLFLPKGCNEASVWYQQMLNQFFSQWYLREMVVSGECSSVAKLIFTVFPHFHPRMRNVKSCGDRSRRWGEAAPERTVRRATGMLCSAEHNEALWLLARYTLWNEFQNKVLDYRQLFQAIAGRSTTVEKLWHQQLGIEEPELLRKTCQAELKISKYFS